MNNFQSICLESGIKYDAEESAISWLYRKFILDERVGQKTKEEFFDEQEIICVDSEKELEDTLNKKWDDFCHKTAEEAFWFGNYNDLAEVEEEIYETSLDFDYAREWAGMDCL